MNSDHFESNLSYILSCKTNVTSLSTKTFYFDRRLITEIHFLHKSSWKIAQSNSGFTNHFHCRTKRCLPVNENCAIFVVLYIKEKWYEIYRAFSYQCNPRHISVSLKITKNSAKQSYRRMFCAVLNNKIFFLA